MQDGCQRDGCEATYEVTIGIRFAGVDLWVRMCREHARALRDADSDLKSRLGIH